MNDLKYTFVYDLPSDSLNYFLRAHVPIVNSNILPALNYIINDSLESPKRAFIFQYWNEVYKDRAASNFEKYMEVAKSVDKEYYNTVGHGFQTDRGYIFLKYGRPNNILPVEDDPAAPPYEIWFYNYLEYTGQSNVKFLFYCPTKVNNHYDLLHSTCRNERNNPQWEIELYKNSPNEIMGNSIDATGVQDNWGRMAKRYFNQF
jgi:GWxTD domain-containing protein